MHRKPQMSVPARSRWRPARQRLTTLAIAGLISAVSAYAAAHRAAIVAIARPDTTSFAPDQIARGQALALVGNCLTCHQAHGTAPYAGGLAIATPFGILYSSNITPDEATGIGSWSRAAFGRAMHDGVSRDGHHLYPALPYEHFTHVADDDLDALYAFLMTRQAVKAVPPDNQLTPPFGFRPLLVGWKLLFLKKGVLQPSATKSAEWNRGMYLAEGLAHCGGCHTPRNAFGAEAHASAYDGGWAEGWYAPPLDARSPARRAWTSDRLYTYLRTGLDADHAAAAGPMGPVAYNLSRASEADVRAIAVYIASLMSDAPSATRPDVAPTDRKAKAAQAQPEGAALYASACAACHEAGAPMMKAGRPSLSVGSPLWEDDPRDVMAIMLQGLKPPTGPSGPAMPAYGEILSDAQLGAVAAYIRTRYTDLAPWPDLAAAAGRARKEGAAP